MSITATEIQNVRFGEARRGYNPDEVDEFLERVAGDVDTMNRALAEAASRLSEAEERAQQAEEQLAEAEQALQAAQAAAAASPTPAAPAPQATAASAADGISEEVIARAFIAAQVSADKLKEEALKEAEKLYREADAKAKDIVRDAYSERERTLSEIEHLREASERFRTEFLSLINHYSADAQKRFAEFGELSPTGSGQAAAQSMLDANNAAVPSSASDKPVPTSARAARPAPAPSPAAAPAAAASYPIDDDLEIEEID